ncbi:MAG: hypothetical protein M0C28_44625, partial [Candidatus Moduliflexus flocculans]|nr:hypothetical protein [Candidatus Moduliflexus flocculans]
GVRYLAMRDLLDLAPDDKKLKSARKLAHKEGPIAHVLSKMNEEGCVAESGDGLWSEVQVHGVGVDPAGAAWRVGEGGQAHQAGVQVLSRPRPEPWRADLRHDQQLPLRDSRLPARQHALVIDGVGLRTIHAWTRPTNGWRARSQARASRR